MFFIHIGKKKNADSKADGQDGSTGKQGVRLDERSNIALRVIGSVLIINTVIVFARGMTGSGWGDAITYSITSVVVASAALFIGVLVGFLFGIPRASEQQDVNSQPQQSIESGSSGSDDNDKNVVERGNGWRHGYRPNTNLEQISDWLTKILVGVGLTNLSQIPSALSSLSVSAAPAFGTFDGNHIYALGVMLFFSVSGFLVGFLWARIYLPFAFALSDHDIYNLNMNLFRKIVSQQSEKDFEALRMAQRQLDLPVGAPDIQQEELNRCFDGATSPALETIFYRARGIREDNWMKEGSDLKRMERTIPIFRALNAEDKTKKFHTILGQLGYALTDKKPGDYAEAVEVLNEAIRRRGSWKKGEWLNYELARAKSRIGLLPKDQQASPEEIAKITDDLRVVVQSGRGDLLGSTIEIQSFLKTNGISIDSLHQSRETM